jgi:NAD+ kinase
MDDNDTTNLRVIVFHSSHRPNIAEAAARLTSRLNSHVGIEVVANYAVDDTEIHDVVADVAVVLGGDGSILRGCRQLGRQQIPIVGVNLGRLGFLADLTPDELLAGLEQLKSGQFTVTDHLMFQCRHQQRGGSTFTDIGLNEVCVTSGGSLKMVDIALAIDGEHVTTFSCDGLIISSPVGSTAHNLSAGGPILRQDLQALVVTPICPHTLTVRPIVDSADRVYELTVDDAPDGMMLAIDGQIHRPVQSNDRITIQRSDQCFQLIRLPGHSYYSTLHRKLGWYGQLEYRERRGHADADA